MARAIATTTTVDRAALVEFIQDRHRAVLVPMLEDMFKTRRKADWLAALEAAKVPCGPINNLAEVFTDPQVIARQMVHMWHGKQAHPLTDALSLVASPLKLGATPVRSDLPPPLLGQHTNEVLCEWLGTDERQLAELRTRGIV